jgi:hypothetical protein
MQALFEEVGKMLMRNEVIPIGPISPDLQKDPAHKPVLQQELNRYFRFLQDEQPAIADHLIENYDQLEPAREDVGRLRCVVAIPVAGHQEYGNMYDTLAQLNKQSMPKDEFEVVLYLNLPGAFGENDRELAESISLTLGEIERFRSEQPDLQVRYAVSTYRGSSPFIGEIRADLWNIIGYDMHMRGRDEDILVVSADADIAHLNSGYLEGMVQTFDREAADIVTAGLYWQGAPGQDYYSYTNRILRYQAFLDNVRDRYTSGRLHTADANTGISLATYFAVGGYDRSLEIGEMNLLADRIRRYRCAYEDDVTQESGATVEAKSYNSWLRSNSRRLVQAMALGHPPYDAWDQRLIRFGANDAVRNMSESQEREMALAAEAAAKQHWKKWIRETTPFYIGNVPMEKEQRLLSAAWAVLGFSKLYD